MRTLVASRWFALFDLGCALLSGAIWYVLALNGQVSVRSFGGWVTGSWPLWIALLPLLLRVAAGRFPIHRTRFDLALALFLLTAGLGVWAAYDPAAGWSKFGMILAAVLVFYALAGQPYENLWWAAGLLSLSGLAIAAAFLFGVDFESQPADLEVLSRIGRAWMSIRPVSLSTSLAPNLTGGLLACLVPLPVAAAAAAWRGRRPAAAAGTLAAAGLMAFGLAMTSSRGAWMALTAGAGLGCLWAASGIPSRRIGRSREAVFALAVLALALPLAGLFVAWPDGIARLAGYLPGLPSGGSRLELARDTLYLIADFPFTGGGLEAFAGLYSQYIRVIPVFLFAYSHNFFLDVALEQGMFGALALLFILAGSLSSLFARRTAEPGGLDPFLRGAVLVGLATLIVHGLVDDALYGVKGTPLLFALPALAIALSRQHAAPTDGLEEEKSPRPAFRFQPGRHTLWIGGAVILAGLLTAVWRPAISGLYSNLGAIRMARVELEGYPTGKWDAERTQAVIESNAVRSARIAFDRSLKINPNNATAHYRLGLIAVGEGDFAAAVLQLEHGYRAAPGHPGIRKVLGYCYTWNGAPEQALELLTQVPEARNEMEVYHWWWGEQDRDELARLSGEMAERLKETDNLSDP
jgi:hypothetical protein